MCKNTSVAHSTPNGTTNKNCYHHHNCHVAQHSTHQESPKYSTNQSVKTRNQEVQDPDKLTYFPGANKSSPESGTSEEEKAESHTNIGKGEDLREGESRKGRKEERVEGSAVSWSEKRHRTQGGLQHLASSGMNDSNDSVRTHAVHFVRAVSNYCLNTLTVHFMVDIDFYVTDMTHCIACYILSRCSRYA